MPTACLLLALLPAAPPNLTVEETLAEDVRLNIPDEGTDWADVVRDEKLGRVIVIDALAKHSQSQMVPLFRPGDTQIYLNRGMPAKLTLPPAAVARLAAGRDRRVAAVDAHDQKNKRVDAASPPREWTVVVTAVERLDAAAAGRLNAGLPADAKVRWAVGDFRVEANPVATADLLTRRFTDPPDAPKVAGEGFAQWGQKDPEVWRLTAERADLVSPGEPHFMPFVDFL